LSINKQSEVVANIQIVPTDQGMVRIYIEAEGGVELPLDFDADEAEEIAEELEAPLGTVKAQLHRARELLYDLVKNKKEHI
jgi:hypothetical protein